MPTTRTFQKIQRGKETGRGTAVPATLRWLGDMALKESNKNYIPDYPYGVLSQYFTTGTTVSKLAEMTYSSDFTYEEFIDFLSMGVKGGVGPTGAGTDKTWTFLHSTTADPAPTTYTVEFANSDGSNSYSREIEYVFCKKFSISAAIDEPMKFSADMVGRQVTDTAVTGGLPLSTTWEPAQSNVLKVYFHTAWPGSSGTQIIGKIVDVNLDITTGLSEGKYLSGGLYFDNYKPGALSGDLTMTVEFDGVPTSFVDAEQELARLHSRRFVTLSVSGSVIPGSAINKNVTIDLCCFHAEDSIQEMFGNRDGTDTVKFHLLVAYDSNTAKDLNVVVVNGVAAMV